MILMMWVGVAIYTFIIASYTTYLTKIDERMEKIHNQ